MITGTSEVDLNQHVGSEEEVIKYSSRVQEKPFEGGVSFQGRSFQSRERHGDWSIYIFKRCQVEFEMGQV